MNKLVFSKFVFFLFLFLSNIGFSQKMEISATVYDSTAKVPLPNAVAIAVRVKDSLLLGFAHSDKNGHFFMKDFEVDTFSLIVSYPNCDDKTFYIFGNTDNAQLEIPSIVMLAKSKELEDVVIYANKNPIYYRGDTLVYVADSFKVAENAVVEDLLRKLPGIKVEKDGKIKSQGKAIDKVLVDGDEFFGSDATIATKNLAADGVKSVEIYETENEDPASSSEDKIQVLNLTLKEEAKKGYFGRSSLASDFQNFYQGELLMNKFNGAQKISVFALGANTPTTAFGWGDLNKFGIDNELDKQTDDDGNTYWTNYTTQGVPQTLKAGLYYSDKIGKKKTTKIGFSYSFTDARINSNSKSRSQYFLADTTYFSDDSTHSTTSNQLHKFNFSLLLNLDSLTTLEIKPHLTYTNGSTDNLELTNFLAEDEQLTRENAIRNTTNSEAYTFNNKTILVRKFKKPNRQLDLNYTLSGSQNTGDGTITSTNSYFDGLGTNDTIDQRKENQSNSITHYAKLHYTEPLNKKLDLLLEYLYENEISEQDKTTFDKLDDSYSVFNANFSNQFTTLSQQQRVETLLQYKKKKFTLTGGARFRNIIVNNENQISGLTVHQNINTILPRVTFFYNPAQNKRFFMRYSTRVQQPSINDLQPVPNNSNPNNIVLGNTNLLPVYTHAFNFNFNTWQALSGKYIYAGFQTQFKNNDFGDSTSYDPAVIGRMVSQTVNVDGNFSGDLWAGAGFLFFNKVFEINPSMNGNFYKSTSFINGVQNSTLNRMVGVELELSYTKDSIRFYISGDYQYNSPLSSISAFSSTPYSTTTYSGSMNWSLPFWHMKLISELNYTMNDQRANGYNVNYLIWNAEVSKAFLKTENLVLSVMGNDILNQNILAQRSVNSNVITDNKTKIISRYFLVKLTLKFNNNKTKENDADDDEW